MQILNCMQIRIINIIFSEFSRLTQLQQQDRYFLPRFLFNRMRKHSQRNNAFLQIYCNGESNLKAKIGGKKEQCNVK